MTPVFLDLDGTLTDPKPGITRSIVHALEALGLDAPDPDSLEPAALQAPKKEARYPLLVIIALCFLAVIASVFLLADFMAPFDYRAQDLSNRLREPFFLGGDPRYWLGTDELGRDIHSRLLYATRFSLLVAFLGTSIGAIVGTTLGFVAAHFQALHESGRGHESKGVFDLETQSRRRAGFPPPQVECADQPR